MTKIFTFTTLLCTVQKTYKVLFLCIIMMFSFVTPVKSQTELSQSSSIEQELDRKISDLMEKHNVPGFVITYSSNDLNFEKFYGYANVENKEKFNQDTIIRQASIAKLITFMGILKLEEQGKIKLDEEINTYLKDTPINYYNGKKITIRHLLTHTDGLQNNYLEILIKDPKEQINIEDYIRENRPQAVREPGKIITYGNDGANIAGLIIQNVTKISFEVFIKESILEDLNMNRTGFEQPVQSRFNENIASEYYLENSIFKQRDFVVYPKFTPGGGLYSTSSDMQKLLSFFLNRNDIDGESLLQSESKEKMFDRQFGVDQMPGMTYGFLERYQFGGRALMRDGDGTEFKTRVLILPEKNIGVSMYTNIDDNIIREEISTFIMNKAYGDNDSIKSSGGYYKDIDKLGGIYRTVGANKTNESKVIVLFSGMLNINIINENTIEIIPIGEDAIGGMSKESPKWEFRGDNIFKNTENDQYIAFIEDNKGNFLLQSGSKYLANFEKLPWYENPYLQYAYIGMLGLITIFTLIFVKYLMIKSFVRRVKTKDLKLLLKFNFSNIKIFTVLSGIIFTNVFFLLLTRSLFLGDAGVYEGFPVFAFNLSNSFKFIRSLIYPHTILFLVLLGFGIYDLKAQNRKVLNIAIILLSILSIGIYPIMRYWNLV